MLAEHVDHVDVTLAGFEVHVGRHAANDGLEDGKFAAAELHFGARDPFVFCPRLEAVDIDVGAEAQRIDGLADGLLDRADAGEVHHRDVAERVVHEAIAGRAFQHAQLAGRVFTQEGLQEVLERGAALFRIEARLDAEAVRVADVEDAGGVIEPRLHTRERGEAGEHGEALFGDMLRVGGIEA